MYIYICMYAYIYIYIYVHIYIYCSMTITEAKEDSSKFNIRPSVHQKISPKQLIQTLPSPHAKVYTTSPGPGRPNTHHVRGRTRQQRGTGRRQHTCSNPHKNNKP